MGLGDIVKRTANIRVLAVFLIVAAAVAVLGAQGTSFLSKIYLGSGACLVQTGTGSPEGVVTGNICDVFLRTNGTTATVLYVKESGTGNTGWVAMAGGSGSPAPANATYIVQTANGTLSAEQALGALATGMLKNTTTTGVLSIGAAGTDYTSPSSTETVTNKTLDAEGTGNLITVPWKVWMRSGWCQNATPGSTWSTPVTDPAVLACNTGTNTQKATWDFADGANSLSVQNNLMMPSDFTGTVDLRFKWFTSATSGSVVWQAQTICVADAETSDPAFNAASTVTDAAKGTTLQDNDATITGLTVTGCAAGELLYLRVFRDPSHGSDTLAATAQLRGVEITFRRGM